MNEPIVFAVIVGVVVAIFSGISMARAKPSKGKKHDATKDSGDSSIIISSTGDGSPGRSDNSQDGGGWGDGGGDGGGGGD